MGRTKFGMIRVLLCLILSLSFFSLSCGNISAESTGTKRTGTEKARDFTLNDLDGRSVSLSDYAGKENVLLVCTTTWCPHCITIIPGLKDIHKRYDNAGIKILAVYLNEPEDRVRKFRQKYALPYSVLLDTDALVSSEYGIRGVPTIMLIDKQGMIIYRGYSIPADMIEDLTV